jgi:hypothetical protein
MPANGMAWLTDGSVKLHALGMAAMWTLYGYLLT